MKKKKNKMNNTKKKIIRIKELKYFILIMVLLINKNYFRVIFFKNKIL